MDELPAILVKIPRFPLTELQVRHLEFLYTRTAIPKIEICTMVNIEMSTLDRLIQRNAWPMRQKQHWKHQHRVNHKGTPIHG